MPLKSIEKKDNTVRDHVKTHHYQAKESQHQETLNEYYCFYCNNKIDSK